MDVLTKLRDKDGRSFNEPGFMKNQEIHVSIVKINDLIVKALPRTTEIMWDKEKVLDSCEWVESLVEDLFIFNKDIFPNRTIEANIVWTEILENIIYHIDNMVDSPILWTVNNRFWLNSKFVCLLLGIRNFRDRKLEDNNPTGVTLKNCTMTESENFLDEAKIRRLFEEKARLEKDVIFGNLQIPKETLKMAKSTPIVVMDSLDRITNDATGKPRREVDLTMISTIDEIDQDQRTSNRGTNNEIITSNRVHNILKEIQSSNSLERANNLKNLELSNQDWKRLIDISAGGDTIDSKNILVAWNVLKEKSTGNIYSKENPPGTHETCNHTDWFRGKRRVCSNLINLNEEYCTLHKSLKESYKSNGRTQSLFPVFFANFVFYVEPVYVNQIIGKTPKTFEISRSLMTKEFGSARGNKLKNNHLIYKDIGKAREIPHIIWGCNL